ncbi:MAG: MAPEG family protein [Nitratireductor sp.]|nr:MAPEG family protein [Nitratireductor sp.]
MNPNLMLWPLVIHALVTLALYIPMSRARISTVKHGKVKGGVYKLNQGEPEESLRFSNAIRNQNESGVIFYAGVLSAYASHNVGYLLLLLAWAFVIVKTVHVYVHVTTNNLRHRRPVFTVAYFLLIALWVVFAIQLTGLL